MQDFLYIFFHIYKCAGSSIILKIKSEKYKRLCLHLHFGDPDDKNNADGVPLITNQAALDAYLASLSPAEKNRMKYIVGHSTYMGIHAHFPDRPFRYFTFIRNPVARMLSNYNYARFNMESGSTEPWLEFFKDGHGNALSLTELVNKLPEQYNPIIDLLFQFDNADGVPVIIDHYSEKELDRAQAILRKFHFVGITENINDQIELAKFLNMTTEIHYENVTPKNYIHEHELQPAKKVLAAKMQYDLRLYNACVAHAIREPGVRDRAEKD
jgi:hypothetical protein